MGEITLQIANMLGSPAAIAIIVQTAAMLLWMIAAGWISYAIASIIFKWSEAFFHQFVGYQPPMEAGATATGGRSIADNILMSIIQSPAIWWMFLSILAACIILLIFVTILSIIRSEMVFDEKSGNSKAEIYKSAFKALAAFIAVPVMAMVGLLLANMLIAVIYNMLIGQGVTVTGGFIQPDAENVFFDTEAAKNFKEAEKISKEIASFLGGDKRPLYDLLNGSAGNFTGAILMQFGPAIILYPVAYPFIVAALLSGPGKMMAGAVVGVIIRMYNIILLFLMAPPVVSMMPLTKKPFDTWKNKFIGQVLGMYGVVIAVCVATILAFLVGQQMQKAFAASAEGEEPQAPTLSGDFSRQIMTFVTAFAAVTSIKTMDTLISGMFGGESSLSAGEGIAGQALDAAKQGMGKMRGAAGQGMMAGKAAINLHKSRQAAKKIKEEQDKTENQEIADAAKDDTDKAVEDEAAKKDKEAEQALKDGHEKRKAGDKEGMKADFKKAKDLKAEAKKIRETGKKADGTDIFGKKYGQSRDGLDQLRVAAADNSVLNEDGNPLKGVHKNKEGKWVDKDDKELSAEQLVDNEENLKKIDDDYNKRVFDAVRTSGKDFEYKDHTWGGFGSKTKKHRMSEFAGNEKMERRALVMSAMEDSQRSAKIKMKETEGVMNETHSERRIREAEAAAVGKMGDEIEIVEMTVNGRKRRVVMNERVQEEFIKQRAKGEAHWVSKDKDGNEILSSTKATQTQNQAAETLKYGKDKKDLIEGLNLDASNATSGFNQAKGKFERYAAQSENYKQISRTQQYEQSTRMNNELISSAFRLTVGGLGLSNALGVKFDDKSIQAITQMPEKIKEIVDNQVGKLSLDFQKKLMRMQQASYKKKVEDTIYRMEDPVIARRFRL